MHPGAHRTKTVDLPGITKAVEEIRVLPLAKTFLQCRHLALLVGARLILCVLGRDLNPIRWQIRLSRV